MMCRKPAGDSGTGAAHCLWDLNVDQVGCTDILATRWQLHRVRQQRATRNGRRNAHRRGREHAVVAFGNCGNKQGSTASGKGGASPACFQGGA